MAYHILNQFDEQWFASSSEDNDSNRGGHVFQRWSDATDSSSDARSCFSIRQWIIIAMLLLIAGSSLYIAFDARRQTTDLQQQIQELKTRTKK
jgi:hypothetical protein